MADPQPVPPWEWRRGNSVSGETLLLGDAARGFSLRRSQRDAYYYIVGLNKSGSESASRSPNDTQKNGAPPLNRQNGGHILEYHQL